MKKKVSIIGSVGLPANYGGWETLVNHLTLNLSAVVDFEVYCSAKKYKSRLDSFNGAKLKYINLDANGMQSIPYDLLSILMALRKTDTLLILGVSGCIFLPLIKLVSNKRIIVNIDGMEWKRAKWNWFAKWFLKLSESVAVRFADLTVSDNKAIQEYIYSEYGIESELIAYGADHVKRADIIAEDALKYPFLKKSYAFKVCRIEPENNINMILESFESNINFTLVIVGNWSNSEYGTDLKEKYGNNKNFYLLDPIYDEVELNKLRGNCSVYIHGHSAGGTNPSLVEAMALSLPILAYSVNYNRETTHGYAKYFNSKESLIHIIDNIDTLELEDMSVKLKLVADEHYTWLKISEQYAKIF